MSGVTAEEQEFDGVQPTITEAFRNDDGAGALLQQSRSTRLLSTTSRYNTRNVHAGLGAEFRTHSGPVRASAEMRYLPNRGLEIAQASRQAGIQVRSGWTRMSDHLAVLRSR